MRINLIYKLAKRRARQFSRNESGVAATEFALILPIMLLLFLSAIVASDAYSASRKVSGVVSAMSDIVAQYEDITRDDMMALMSTSITLMRPYTAKGMDIKITSVTQNSDGDNLIDWSIGQAPNPTDPTYMNATTPYTAGDEYPNLPAGVVGPNTSVIVAEVTYSHNPLVNAGTFTGAFNEVFQFSEKFYSRPRVAVTVNCTDCPNSQGTIGAPADEPGYYNP